MKLVWPPTRKSPSHHIRHVAFSVDQSGRQDIYALRERIHKFPLFGLDLKRTKLVGVVDVKPLPVAARRENGNSLATGSGGQVVVCHLENPFCSGRYDRNDMVLKPGNHGASHGKNRTKDAIRARPSSPLSFK